MIMAVGYVADDGEGKEKHGARGPKGQAEGTGLVQW